MNFVRLVTRMFITVTCMLQDPNMHTRFIISSYVVAYVLADFSTSVSLDALSKPSCFISYLLLSIAFNVFSSYADTSCIKCNKFSVQLQYKLF